MNFIKKNYIRNIIEFLNLKYFDKKLNKKIFGKLTLIFLFVNKSLTISVFSYVIAVFKGVS